jgi:hypothetical protein
MVFFKIHLTPVAAWYKILTVPVPKKKKKKILLFIALSKNNKMAHTQNRKNYATDGWLTQ